MRAPVNIYISKAVFENSFLDPFTADFQSELSDTHFRFWCYKLKNVCFYIYDTSCLEYGEFIKGLAEPLKNHVIDLPIRAGKEILDLLRGGKLSGEFVDKIPHLIVGDFVKNEKEELLSLGISVNAASNFITNGSELQLGIQLASWLKNKILKDNFHTLIIEDPFFLAKFKNKEIIASIFEGVRLNKVKNLVVFYKENNIREYVDQGRDRILAQIELEERIDQFKKIIRQLSPECKVTFYPKAVHDRMIITNKEVFLTGNSFNMSRQLSTFIAKYDLIQYLRSSTES